MRAQGDSKLPSSLSTDHAFARSTTCMHEKNRASVWWVRARDDNNQNTPQTYPQPQATPTHAAVNSPQTYKQTAVFRSPLRNTTELTRFVRTRGSIGGVGWVGRGTLQTNRAVFNLPIKITPKWVGQKEEHHQQTQPPPSTHTRTDLVNQHVCVLRVLFVFGVAAAGARSCSNQQL